MKHTHMAIGLIPEDLVNISVVLEFTPGQRPYTLTITNEGGEAVEGGQYEGDTGESFDYDLTDTDLDSRVFHGLAHREPLHARLMQSLAGFGYLKWLAPAGMPNKERAKFGADK
ncbi:hypothetical protein ABZ916_25815 [Streptomyces sp. NPDC046853]|uniref:hypothetical protein n=1 Tax=Streptomyces sp. NPDC046853 TaxID=3154920 RepID=UPI0033DF3267